MKDTFNSFRFVTTVCYKREKRCGGGGGGKSNSLQLFQMQAKRRRRSARVIVDSKGGLHGAQIIGCTTVNANDQWFMNRLVRWQRERHTLGVRAHKVVCDSYMWHAGTMSSGVIHLQFLVDFISMWCLDVPYVRILRNCVLHAYECLCENRRFIFIRRTTTITSDKKLHVFISI